MADARERLQAAMKEGKGKIVAAPKAPPAPAKAPARSAPPKKAAPPKPPAPSRSDRSAAKKAADEKPAKGGSLFKKKKKGKKGKKAEKAEKPKETKKAPKPEKSSSSGGGGIFQKFTQHIVDELKDAASEISPKALVETASQSLKNIKDAVSLGKSENEPEDSGSASESASAEDRAGDAGMARDEAPLPAEAPAPPSGPGPGGQPQGGGGEPAAANFSPAKVQRAPKKKEKPEPEPEAAAPGAAAGDLAGQPVAQQPSLEGGDQPAPSEGPPTAGASPADEPPQFSAVKVQKAPSARSRKPAVSDDDEAPGPRPEAQERDTGIDIGEPVGTEREAEPDVGDIEDAAEAREEPEAPVEREELEETGEAAGPEEEQEQPGADAEGEAAAEGPPEAAEEGATTGPDPQTDQKESEPEAKEKPKQERKSAPQPTVKLSKTEQALRGFQSLQVLLDNPIWGPVITDETAKPSSLYSPRDRFDTQFSDPVFRDGLKAASRLSAAFSFDLDRVGFDEDALKTAREFPLDPEGRIKKEEQLLTQSLDEETVKQAVGLLKDPKVRHLLFSASTRAGTFVPTIEILARIYLSLRKRNDVNPGQRLAIQEEVLLRYQKSAYTEAKAKRAGSLAINYFSDYLVEYGMKVYKDRFDSAPEGQNNIESHWRRHDVIKSHCFGVFDQWGTRVGLSAHASTNLKARFAETADLFLKETVGDNPNAEPEEGEN